MHSSALQYGKLFFETYCKDNQGATVVDIGAQNVNGSLKDVCPDHLHYVGVDFVEGLGVDIVLDDPYKLPFEDNSVDFVVCSSVFEHSQFFWLLFLEVVRILKKDAMFYLNVPSNGSFHRYPVDCWRFYPDSGHALAEYAQREGYPLTLIESFVGKQSEGSFESGAAWHDYVAIFYKSTNISSLPNKTIIESIEGYTNGYLLNREELSSTFISPDHTKIIKIEKILAERDAQLAERDAQLAERDAQLAERDAQIINLLLSRSWRLTKPFRLLGHGTRQLKLMALQSLREVYRLMPLAPSQRAVLRSWYYRNTAIKFVLTASEPTHPAAGEQAVAPFTRAALASAPIRILLIERSVPKPNQDAGSMMIYSFIRVFRQQGYAVTFFPVDLTYDPDYTPALQALGVTCLHVPLITSLHEHLKEAGSSYDYILSCRPDFTTAILQLLRTHCPQARILYETHDLHYVRQERQAELEQNADVRNELLKHVRWRKDQELGIVQAVDCTIVVSEQERTTLLHELPERYVEVIPVVSETRCSSTGYSGREGLVFIGGYDHQPNADAVFYFVREILPLVVAQAPEIRFHLVGSNAPAEINALADSNVIVHGFVPDLDELMNQVRISVNPLRFGAGVKGKMITSMFYGVPCIGTSVAVEGMGVVPEQQALVADTPQEFAAAVLRLYRDQALWERLSTAGRALVEQNFSLEAANRGFKRIFAAFSEEQPCNDLCLERVVSHDAWLQTDRQREQQRRQEIETALAADGEPYLSRGFCFVCGEEVSFHSDLQYGFPQPDGTVLPNWRERVVCPICGLNNRMRATIHLFHLLCAPSPRSSLYLTEQTTSLFSWFKEQYTDVVGSEFLGDGIPAGATNSNGIRNESLTALSFSDNQFDAILSFDVIEHIPEYLQAFKECLRCLKPGGTLFFTVPFAHADRQHIVRAELDKDGAVRHLLPPEYHGDPINKDGCLCFYHFGWELLDQLRDIGFRDVAAYFYWSERFGYLGGDQLLFKATK